MKERKPVFVIGDKVRIVNYGALMWEHKNEKRKCNFKVLKEDEKIRVMDWMPELVGKIGIVDNVSVTQDIPSYSIDGIPQKHAWYDEGQMELISKNPNR